MTTCSKISRLIFQTQRLQRKTALLSSTLSMLTWNGWSFSQNSLPQLSNFGLKSLKHFLSSTAEPKFFRILQSLLATYCERDGRLVDVGEANLHRIHCFDRERKFAEENSNLCKCVWLSQLGQSLSFWKEECISILRRISGNLRPLLLEVVSQRFCEPFCS